MEYFKKNEINAKVYGVLSIEHSPNKDGSTEEISDGLCFNVLCDVSDFLDGCSNVDCFDWIDVPLEIGNKVSSFVSSKSYVSLPFDFNDISGQ